MRDNTQTKYIASNSVYDIIEATVLTTCDCILSYGSVWHSYSQIFHINPL